MSAILYPHLSSLPFKLHQLWPSYLNQFAFSCFNCFLISIPPCFLHHTALFSSCAQTPKMDTNAAFQTSSMLPTSSGAGHRSHLVYLLTSVQLTSVLLIKESVPTLAQYLIQFHSRDFLCIPFRFSLSSEDSSRYTLRLATTQQW